MGRVNDLCLAICNSLKGALDEANILGSQYVAKTPSGDPLNATLSPDGRIYVGNPLVPELVKILAEPPGTWQISVFPLGPAKDETAFSPYDQPLFIPGPTPSVAASVASGVITFSGSVGTQPINVHTVVDADGDAYVQTTPNQSIDSVASAVAAAINALDLPGVSASASGAAVTTEGISDLRCNIGGTGSTIAYEVGRYSRSIVATVWANDPYARELLADAIVARVGTAFTRFLSFPDGSQFYLENTNGGAYDDDSQSSYSAYVARINFTVQYGILFTSAVSVLGAVKNETTVGKNPERDIYVG